MAALGLAVSSPAYLDCYTQFASQVLDAPVVCVSLLDASRRFVASSYGMPPAIALLHSWSFMKHVPFSGRPLLVTDGRKDPLASMNPSVREGTVVAYLGMRVVGSDEGPFGTISIMDRKPRQWSPPQIDFLRYLSSLLVREVESRNVPKLAGSESRIPTIRATTPNP